MILHRDAIQATRETRRHLSWQETFLAATVLCLLASAQQVSGQYVHNPRRIAEGPDGQVLVTDRTAKAVVGVDKKTLEPVWSFPLPGEGAPFGIATWRNLVFVGDTQTQNVRVYRLVMPDGRGNNAAPPTLEFLYNLGHTNPGQPGEIVNPTDIAVDAKQRRVFVLDTGEKKVKIYDVEGNLRHLFTPVDEAGYIMRPVAIAVDEARQEVLVSDYGNPAGSFTISTPPRILIYNYDGQLLFQINGNRTTQPSTKFVRPQGLVADGIGRIFLTAALRGQILVLDRASGMLMGELGSPGNEPEQLALPLDLLLDEKSGDLFVTNNRGARRVEVLRRAGRLR